MVTVQIASHEHSRLLRSEDKAEFPKQYSQWRVTFRGYEPVKAFSAARQWDQYHFTREDLRRILSNWDRIARWQPLGSVRWKGDAYHPSAKSRSYAPAPIKAYVDGVRRDGEGLRILYHGAGRDMPGAALLAQNGTNSVRVYDPFHPDAAVRKLPDGQFDEIHSHYTLNVVAPAIGKRIFREIYNRLDPEGKAIISVRTDINEMRGRYEDLSPARSLKPSERVPGKNCGSAALYVHRDYVGSSRIPQGVYGAALRVLEKELPNFDYTIVKYNRRNGSVSFLHSPDWDSANEPLVDAYVVVAQDGRTKIGKSNAIYHQKWSFVGDDYTGFDVEKSKIRTRQYMSAVRDLAAKKGVPARQIFGRIGNPAYWKSEIVPLIGG